MVSTFQYEYRGLHTLYLHKLTWNCDKVEIGGWEAQVELSPGSLVVVKEKKG